MAKTAILSIRVVSDNRQARTGLGEVNQSVQGVETTMRRLGELTVISQLGSQLMGLAQQSVTAASDAQQAAGAVTAVFGTMSSEVQRLADDAAASVGLSASSYNEMASVLGAQLSNLGVPADQLIGQTDELIALGSDLAATFGGTTADAVGALSSLMRGERDPIERFGVTMNQASIDAWLLANGMDGLTGDAERAAQAQATLALLTEQTANVQGQFASETDTYAVSQQIANAQMQDAMADLGETFLPLLTQGAQLLGQFAQWTSENSSLVLVLTGVLAAFVVGVWAMNVAFLANPMTWIVLGVMAAVMLLIAGIWWLAENWDSVMAWLEDVWGGFVGWIEDGIDSIIGWIDDAIGWFGSLFGAQNQANSNASNASLTASMGAQQLAAGIYDQPAIGARLTAMAGPSPAMLGTATGRGYGAGSQQTTIVNISGVIDKRGAAREVRKVLGDDARSSGRARPGQVQTW